MRLSVFIDSLRPAGAEISTVRMVPYLVAHGIEPSFVLQNGEPGLQEFVTRHGVSIEVLDGPSRVQRIRQARHLLAAQRPDLVHTILFESDVIGRTAAWSSRLPVVSSWVSDSYGPHFMADPALPWGRVRAARQVDRWTSGWVTRFHAVSRPIADRMCNRMGVRRDRVTVIPRSRAHDAPAAPDRRGASLRAELGLAPDTHVLLAVGRQEFAKGYDVLLRALAKLPTDRPWALVVAGAEGRATPLVHELVGALGLSGSVRFLGPRTDVLDLMLGADTFVLASRFEGFPNVLIEAMAAGLPVVAPDIDVVLDTLDRDVHAKLFRADDPADLATVILETWHEGAAARQRAARARELFECRYSDEVVFPQYVEFYRSVLDRHRHEGSRS